LIQELCEILRNSFHVIHAKAPGTAVLHIEHICYINCAIWGYFPNSKKTFLLQVGNNDGVSNHCRIFS